MTVGNDYENNYSGLNLNKKWKEGEVE